MAEITFKGTTIHTEGNLPAVGTKAPNFTLTASDLSEKSLNDYAGKNVVLNIFPRVDTGDLPFALNRFCAAEGISNVETLSDFKNNEFDKAYGSKMTDGPLNGLLSRAVVIINTEGNVVYNELVPEITQEPDYNNAINALK